MGIPFELITFIGSTLIGGLLRVFSTRSQAKADRELALVALIGKQGDLYKAAREFDNKGFRFTRRIIAISSTFAIVVLPVILGAFMPDMPIWIGYTEMKSGFWPFTDSTDVTKWTQMSGIVITPFHTHLMSSIVGMYFGGSIASRK